MLGVEVVGPLAGRSVEAIGRAAPGLLQEGTVRVMQGNVMEGEEGRRGEGWGEGVGGPRLGGPERRAGGVADGATFVVSGA